MVGALNAEAEIACAAQIVVVAAQRIAAILDLMCFIVFHLIE
jgi:hypothetical protein